MNDDSAIELNNVVLDFPHNYSKFTFFKEIISRRSPINKKFRALENIDLKINKGEVFGIIGPNGAGKSTILRVIAGIYAPDEGRVITKGRIVLLAGLGAGFQANLTGRENIFLSSSIYGMGNLM